MDALLLVLATVFALLAALVTALDTARRGQACFRTALAVGGVTLLACVGVTGASDALVSGYASLTGRPVVVSTPRAYLGLLVAVVAAVTGTVLLGYGVVSRFRQMA